MKMTLMAVGFLFLAVGLYLEIWPPNQPQMGWVCEETIEPEQTHEAGSNAFGGIIYACGTSRYDGYAQSNDTWFPKAGKFDTVLSGGTTFALVGVGFLVASIAVGQNKARSGPAAAPVASGPNPAMVPPPMPGPQAPPAPAAPGPPGPQGPPGPPPGFGR